MIDLKQGDCLELMSKLPDKSVDMILADLPYGSTKNHWDSVIDLGLLWEQYKRIIKDDTPILLFSSEPFTFDLVNSNRKMYKYRWYWLKEKGYGVQYSHKQPTRRIEEVCVFYKKAPYYDYQGEKLDKPYKHTKPIKVSGSSYLDSNNGDAEHRQYVWYTHKTKNNVLEFARREKGSLHPSQKPIELLEYLINTYTREGELVLDNTMGSGSTGVACVNTKRDFIGMELDEEYFRIAEKRIQEAQSEIGLDV